jgi:hypothetical protein
MQYGGWAAEWRNARLYRLSYLDAQDALSVFLFAQNI